MGRVGRSGRRNKLLGFSFGEGIRFGLPNCGGMDCLAGCMGVFVLTCIVCMSVQIDISDRELSLIYHHPYLTEYHRGI